MQTNKFCYAWRAQSRIAFIIISVNLAYTSNIHSCWYCSQIICIVYVSIFSHHNFTIVNFYFHFHFLLLLQFACCCLWVVWMHKFISIFMSHRFCCRMCCTIAVLYDVAREYTMFSYIYFCLLIVCCMLYVYLMYKLYTNVTCTLHEMVQFYKSYYETGVFWARNGLTFCWNESGLIKCG